MNAVATPFIPYYFALFYIISAGEFELRQTELVNMEVDDVALFFLFEALLLPFLIHPAVIIYSALLGWYIFEDMYILLLAMIYFPALTMD